MSSITTAVRAVMLANLMMFLPVVYGIRGGVRSQYQLKERSLQGATTIITLDQIQKYLITFNDDSAPKAMDPCLIQLFYTDGDLPTNSLNTVAAALEDFLFAELNAVYAPNHAVEEVHASFPAQEKLSDGSQLLTNINITFVYEPSPENDQVEVWLQTIMSDLTYFVQNITYLDGGSDPELSNITDADYKPYYANGDQNPSIPGITDNPTRSEPPLYSILPTIFAGVLVVLLVGFFVLRRQRSKRDDQVPKDLNEEQRSLNAKVQPVRKGDELLEDDSDIFSFEVSLIESPAMSKTNSGLVEAFEAQAVPKKNRESPSIKTVEVHEMESDLFSGIHSNVTGVSPRNIEESRSIFSFLSGFTGASASTVRHSNVTKEEVSATAVTTDLSVLSSTPKAGNGETPRSRVSSLFAFSEEEEEDISGSSEDEKSKSPVSAPFDEGRNAKANIEPEALSASSSGEFGPQIPSQPTTDSSCMLKGSLAAQSGAEGAVSARSSDYSYLLNEASSSSTKSPTIANSSENKEKIAVIAPTETRSLSAAKVPPLGISFDSYNTNTGSLMAESKGASSPASSVGEAPDGSDDRINEGPSEEYGESPVADKDFEKAGRKWGLSTSAMAALGNLAMKARRNKTAQVDAANEDPKSATGEYLAPNPSEVNLRWNSPSESAKNAAIAAAFVGVVSQATSTANSETGSLADKSASGGKRGRRHAKSTAADGTEEYQSEAMQPKDWSVRSASPSATSPRSEIDLVDAIAIKKTKNIKKDTGTPRSHVTNDSTVSALSVSTGMNETSTSDSLPFDATPTSPSKKLISDLVWLEKKIAGATKSVRSTPLPLKDEKEVARPPALQASDSISFSSNDAGVLNSPSNDSSSLELNSYGEGGQPLQGVHSIVCKDCFAPPGKLKIVIHSTKDGPAVHTVKKGSSLEGHLFPGDLIISVDSVDTRSYTAEQVMKMMTARTKFERKITVLHFEQTGSSNNNDAAAPSSSS